MYSIIEQQVSPFLFAQFYRGMNYPSNLEGRERRREGEREAEYTVWSREINHVAYRFVHSTSETITFAFAIKHASSPSPSPLLLNNNNGKVYSCRPMMNFKLIARAGKTENGGRRCFTDISTRHYGLMHNK